MLFVHIVFVVGIIVGLLTLYAPGLEELNNRRLLEKQPGEVGDNK